MLVKVLDRPLKSPIALIVGTMKFIAFFLIVMVFILHHELVKLIIRDLNRRDRYFLKSVSLTSKLGLRLLNIQVTYQDGPFSGPGLFVSNHLSYLDVLVLFSRYPALFITSREMGDVFLLGRLTKLAGCFHVERRKHLRSDDLIRSELVAMKEKLSLGMSLFLFPEGTSSDGVTVLPFKAHFLQTSMDLNLPVRPLCLAYDWHHSSREEICWYGDMGFAGHLFNVCCGEKIRAKVKSLPFDARQFPDRFSMAEALHQLIKKNYEKN